MKKVRTLVFAVLVFCLYTLQASAPQKWELQRYAQFLQGKFQNISVSYEGELSLAPREEKLPGPSEEFFLSLLITQDGTTFLGTGHSGKLYRMDKENKIELYYKFPEMDILSLAQDRSGHLYAATSPNGKIYKITEKNKGSVFFNPHKKYIWDLTFLESGILLAAVGESGGIYAISNQGEGTLIFNSEANHILCLLEGSDGNIYAGSGGKGRVYRLSKDRKASILFESPFEEIKTIALDGKGYIYAGAGGTVTQAGAQGIAPAAPRATTDVSITVTPSAATAAKAAPVTQKQPSALYKINSSGIAKVLWKSDEDLIYSMVWDEDQARVIFGTGNQGRVFCVNESEKTALLLQKDSEQVYLLQLHDDKIYSLSNNPSMLSLLHAEQGFSGEYTSRIFDAKIISQWGKIEWQAEMPSGTTLQVFTRSGNSQQPNQTWSNWSPPYKNSLGEQILNPDARYIQFKIMMKSDSGKVSPSVRQLALYYLQTNIVPAITALEILPANIVFIEPPSPAEKIWGLDTGTAEQAKENNKNQSLAMAKKSERKGFRTVVWQDADPNGDSLLYSIHIKGSQSDKWRLLKENWTSRIFAFDTLDFPDGTYFIKLEASDSPSNPLGKELKTEKISRALVIDNSLPVVKAFKSERRGNALVISFIAEDVYSRIKEVKFLVRPDEWRSVFPADGICDSKQEIFNFTFGLPQNFDDLITIKVIDDQGNVGVHRATF